jgi:hypothetical protein
VKGAGHDVRLVLQDRLGSLCGDMVRDSEFSSVIPTDVPALGSASGYTYEVISVRRSSMQKDPRELEPFRSHPFGLGTPI